MNVEFQGINSSHGELEEFMPVPDFNDEQHRIHLTLQEHSEQTFIAEQPSPFSRKLVSWAAVSLGLLVLMLIIGLLSHSYSESFEISSTSNPTSSLAETSLAPSHIKEPKKRQSS